MKLLVTGGAGFIGSHIAEQALGRGWEVAVVDDLSSGRRENVPAGATFFEIDIRDRDAVFQAVEKFQPDVLSHQAAQASVAISVREPVRDAEINVIGTLNLLDASVANGVSRFVFASTGGAIYGEVPSGQATEETAPRPLSPYAASKFAVENYLRCYESEHGLQSTVLRYANVYGPRQDPHGEAGVVAIFVKRLLAGESLQVNAMSEVGDSGCIRDYVHVNDVVKANLAAAEGTIPHAVINVGTGLESTTQHLAELLQHAMETSVELKFAPRRPGDTQRSLLSPQRFTELFGAPLTLSAGLVDTIAWFRHQHAEIA
ncbi:MAG: SDR family NAD(P)-dependent oxidoreductase [Planctomycetaceae bacterium]|nr:SDR family NAD(P)-dependent oxidoreductase [Planctomycetaceae bacterium]MCB9952017.1 SDR family NAD(P)-dependent oxidoreductase [Planctomycetaceae bacterium]